MCPGGSTRHTGASSSGKALVSLRCLQEVNTGNTTRVKRKLALIWRARIKIPPVCKHSSRTGVWEGASRLQVPSALGLLTLAWL